MNHNHESSILIEQDGKVGIITLNRPEVLNALNDAVVSEIADVVEVFEANDAIHCIVLAGSEKAFAAGGDIDEMLGFSFADVYQIDFVSHNWNRIKRARKPLIAVVSGYALGGGCELAMLCDLVFASDTAKFGQPEITLGTMPGAGGTQRLPRAIGKAKAMDLCLTGRFMDAQEAENAGLVARIFPVATHYDESLTIVKKMAEHSLPALMMVKESVNRAFESGLSDGLWFERRLFHSSFALEDQKEGMRAFVEKRKAQFTNR